MTIELIVWLAISLVGVAGIPFVIHRRRRELLFHRLAGGNGARRLLLLNRASRATALSIGVTLCTFVALVAWLAPESQRFWSRLVTIGALILVEVIMVAVLWADELFAGRIDRVPDH